MNSNKIKMSSSSVEPLEKKMLYFARFTEGFSLRCLIEFFKSIFTDINFHFTSDKIFIKETNATETLLVYAVLEGDNIGSYEYYSDNEKEIFGFTLKTLKNTTNNIGKKDSFQMWKYDHRDRNMYMEKTSNKNISQSKSHDFIKCLDLPECTLDFPEYDSRPNCSILGSDFAEMCKSMASKKCDKICVKAYPHGIIFEAQTGSEISGGQYKFGDCERPIGTTQPWSPDLSDRNVLTAEISKFYIKNDIIKALSKINSFISNGNSNIQIFNKAGSPMKICSKIGSAGNISIILRDCTP